MNSSFESQRQELLKRRSSWQDRRFPTVNAATARFVSSAAAPPPNNIPPTTTTTSFLSTNSNIYSNNPKSNNNNNKSFPAVDDVDDLLVSSVVPPVTVVLEGRSICQRISLHKHASYQSLAKALRQMFVEGIADDGSTTSVDDTDSNNNNNNNDNVDLDLSNAVPGHLIAYEDMENDLLLAGDLNWKDFVRVAKRIRILPAKGNSRKGRGGA